MYRFNKTKKFESSLDIHIEDHTFTAFFTYTPAIKGRSESGQKLEPDEDALIEITGIYLENDKRDLIDIISSSILEAVEEKIWESIADDDCPEVDEL